MYKLRLYSLSNLVSRNKLTNYYQVADSKHFILFLHTNRTVKSGVARGSGTIDHTGNVLITCRTCETSTHSVQFIAPAFA